LGIAAAVVAVAVVAVAAAAVAVAAAVALLIFHIVGITSPHIQKLTTWIKGRVPLSSGKRPLELTRDVRSKGRGDVFRGTSSTRRGVSGR